MAHQEMERQHLEEADRHLAEGAARIAGQEKLVATLSQDGHDTTEAQRLLGTFKAVQEAGEAHRQLILEALAEPGDGATAG